MNKLYKTLDLYAAWLGQNDSYNSYGGIKNIIGIKVEYNGKQLFYSILDNCFFEIFPEEELKTVSEVFSRRLFVKIYEYQEPPWELKTLGMDLFEKIKREYITKEELISFKTFLKGHFSDLDYEILKINSDINPWDNIDENTMKTVKQYEEKQKRPIIYEECHLYNPKKEKILK